jgi:hypothetical protein
LWFIFEVCSLRYVSPAFSCFSFVHPEPVVAYTPLLFPPNGWLGLDEGDLLVLERSRRLHPVNTYIIDTGFRDLFIGGFSIYLPSTPQEPRMRDSDEGRLLFDTKCTLPAHKGAGSSISYPKQVGVHWNMDPFLIRREANDFF